MRAMNQVNSAMRRYVIKWIWGKVPHQGKITEPKPVYRDVAYLKDEYHPRVADSAEAPRRALDYMIERIRERNATLLPITWNRDRLVSTVDSLEDAGYLSMSLAESAIDDKDKVAYISTAVKAYSDAGNLRVKLGVSKEMLELLRKRQQQEIEENAPDPNDRIDYIEWVYTNKIEPTLNKEVQDAEIVVREVQGQGSELDVVRDERVVPDSNGGAASGKDDSSTD